LGGGDHILAPLPFLVGQVAWICFFVHTPMLHNPRRLFRQALRCINTKIVQDYGCRLLDLKNS
jgi:hypothetical protein